MIAELSAIVLSLLLLTGCAPSRPADDLTISTKVKIELLADPALGAMRLGASTLNGIVTLSGTVSSQADADRAAAAARRVPGVRGVKSELKIAGYQFSVTTRSRVTPSDRSSVGTSVTIARGPQTKATVEG